MTESRARELKGKYGNLVLITGASSGIGKALAIEFASAGFDVVLTARNETTLHELAQKLRNDYKISPLVVAGDLALEKDQHALLAATAQFSIGIVVLNAGYGNTGSFINTQLERELNMVDLNVRAVLVLAHAFAERFVQAKKGALVFLSSMVSFQGVPYMANYSATKAYVQNLAEGIGFELKEKGIDVLSVAPGPVDTGFSDRANIIMTNMASPERVAGNIIKAIGNKRTVYPASNAKWMHLGLSLLPRSLKVMVMGLALRKDKNK